MNRRDLLRASTAVGATALAAGAAAASPAPAAAPKPAAAVGGKPLRVHIVLYEGVEELDFIAPYEVFSAAPFFAARPVEVRYVTVDGTTAVRAAYGTEVHGVRPWAPHRADLLVVPGGGYARRDSPGVWAEIQRGALPKALAAAARPGLTVSALCTGTMLLSAAGLTRNRPCTTHHRARQDLQDQGGVVKNARVVDDGDLVTAGGVTSGLDLGLWLVRRELGPDAATGLEAMLEYEARGTVWTSAAAAR
ncbi:DJ-1/PfpI family protein [Streptomyces sp. NPDC093546]|uniref:DJ-1/PfpI family protein n=1 Tax=Streptomyces sp. NPDC093546 TaxID=3366040 RepID=UPI00382BE95F